MAAAIPTIMKMSPNIETTPRLTISVSASISFVIRVMSRPTGFRSKKESGRNCRWRNSSRRRSYMARWPTIAVMRLCPYRASALAVSTATYAMPSRPRRARPSSRPISPAMTGPMAESMMNFAMIGGAICVADSTSSRTSAITTHGAYGRMYPRSRRMRRAS